MREWEDAKKRYEEIPVSDQLSGMVARTIQSVRGEQSVKRRVPIHRKRVLRWGSAAVAAIFLCFVVIVNSSSALAADLSQIPVIGSLVKLVSWQSYEENTEDYGITVTIPGLQQIGQDNQAFTDKINREIEKMCKNYAEDAKSRALDYRKAFLDTGGTEAEWKEHQIQITVDYRVLSQSDRYLSFLVYGQENWSSAGAENRYYNLDTKNRSYVTLKDLLGNDYRDIADDSIRQQIKKRSQAGQQFFSPGEGGFEGISDTQKFYINTAGNPVIVFEPYEIAPGSAGTVRFEIQKTIK